MIRLLQYHLCILVFLVATGAVVRAETPNVDVGEGLGPAPSAVDNAAGDRPVESASTETTIGHYLLYTNSSSPGRSTLPYTTVDLTAPATTAGSIGAVVFRWPAYPCPDAVKIKFFHVSGQDITLSAERGPFSVAPGGLTTVTMSPPVNVQVGDVIGLTKLTSCGSPVGIIGVLGEYAKVFDGDVTGTVSTTSGTTAGYFALALYGAESTSSEIRTGVLPVVGSVIGYGGVKFQTDVFMASNWSAATGRLVYHPEGTSGSSSDPSVSFSIPANGSATFLDIIGTNLGITGKGSMDVYLTVGSEAPWVAERIYENDGPDGTKGFTADALRPDEALQYRETGALVTPSDLTKFRMNVGLRTLDEPTTIHIYVYGSNGSMRYSTSRTYDANYFEQVTAQDFVGVATQAGDVIRIYVDSGAIYVYGSIVDNITADPSTQLARRIQ